MSWMSCSVALWGRFTVLDTALSVWRWKAACMRRCQTGSMSMAVTKTLRMAAGRASRDWMEPFSTPCSMSSGVPRPASLRAASK